MDKQQVFEQIADIVANQFSVDRDKVTLEMNLKNDLDADSIDFVEFVLELEDTFNAEISDEDAEKLVTLNDVVDYVIAHSAK